VAAFLCALNPGFFFFSPLLATEHLQALLLFGGLLVVAESGACERGRALARLWPGRSRPRPSA
jgi:hypothetical protein